MTKGEELIWDLFMWLREVMPATPENTARQSEWAAKFHELEHPEPGPTTTPENTPHNPPEPDDDGEDPPEHPIAHAARSRKKR